MVRTSLLVVMGCALAGSAAAQDSARGATPTSPTVAVIGDRTITAAELDNLAKERLTRLRNEEYTIRKQVLEEYINRLLIEREAAARGVGVLELTRAEIDAKVAPVTDEQKRAVLESAGPRPGQSEAQALAQIGESLRQSRQAEARRRFANELRAKSGARILLEPPRAAVEVVRGPSKGPSEAPVTIVEFSDFQCPYCRDATQTLRRLQDQYGDNVRLVFRDFPLPIHKDAPKAAEAAACAGEQGEFWKMHDKLFESAASLQITDLKRRAAEIGLNTARFDDCLDSGKLAFQWQQNRAEGQRYGVSATPTFFINGRMVAGALPLQAFTEIVNEELARAIDIAARR